MEEPTTFNVLSTASHDGALTTYSISQGREVGPSRQPHKLKIVGSNPTLATNKDFLTGNNRSEVPCMDGWLGECTTGNNTI